MDAPKIRRGFRPRKYIPSNESAFEILSSEAAYWIGFLLADGWVRDASKTPMLVVEIKGEDREHLEKLAQFIGFPGPIRQTYREDGRVSSAVHVSSNIICRDLALWGIVPRKTSITVVPPTLRNSKDFWRGLIDGDGWVSIRRRGDCMVGVCGTESVCQDFLLYGQRVSGSVSKAQGIHISYEVGKNGHKSAGYGHSRFDGVAAACIVKELYEAPCVSLCRKQKTANRVIEDIIPSRHWNRFQSFEEVRKRAHNMNIKTSREWITKTRDRADLCLPTRPDLTYAERGWISWGNWLGREDV